MNTRSLGQVVTLAVVVALVAGVAVLASGSGPAAFRVGNHETSQRDVDDELRALAENHVLRDMLNQARAQGQNIAPIGVTDGSVTASTSSGWVGLRIGQEVARQEVAHRGFRVTKADRTLAQQFASESLSGAKAFAAMPAWFRHREVDAWTSVAVLDRRLLANPPPALLAAAGAQCPSGRYVSHILVATLEQADAIEAQLAGGADFAELAKAESTDASGSNGGQLGCLDDSTFVEPFATVAKTQAIGVVSAPVQTQYGFHVILVTDQPPQLIVERAAIAEILSHSRGKNVEVDTRYGRWDKKHGQVVPPAVPKG
jgi:peptidyl-prolyl cis-trans isomerase C